MKKLLSLLSVLTISGTAVPTTIAASPYQKEETIKNSEINYSQTNNLEKLNRNKRDVFSCIGNSFLESVKEAAIGAAAGGVGGAAVGSVVPGAGTLAGGATGALGGSATGGVTGWVNGIRKYC
ncbi:MAG: hypothetical protein EHV01_005775 [Spiroplasma sp. hy2]|uniref:hypothetical protein n=1 Tax=Spiroplasma sp. hy2 TaxID=2490850 RepID=UPI00384567DC